MKNFVVWSPEEVPHCFVLDQLQMKGVDLDVELRLGIPCNASFPPNAVFTVDPDFPNNIALADTFYNINRLIVTSPKLREFIELRDPPELEFLPVTILDHKFRPAAKYFIVHPIHPIDALKPVESGAKWSRRNPERIDKVATLVLDEDKIDPSRQLFKLKYYTGCVLLRRDLADAISLRGFTGVGWKECEEYKSL